MNTIKAQKGIEIFYKDWGRGQPIVFSHGWPLSADAWDEQMLHFGQRGFRVIAHDRRGHGRSTPTWDDNTMDQFADDLSALIDELNLDSVILVGHSTGGGEVTRYIGRHGTSRVARLVLVGAVPPIMLKTDDHPAGLPLEVFDSLRSQTSGNRAQYFRDMSLAFYGYNREHAKESQGVRDSFWWQAMMGSIKAQFDSIKAFSETDFTEDLKKIDVPTLIVHGDDDQIVPIKASALLSSKLIPRSVLKIYPGASHGLTQTHQDQFNADLLGFLKGSLDLNQ